MPGLAELRALAKARQRAVNNKISRIKSNSGALVGGSEFDPRKPIGDISSMNSRQANSYIRKLNKFMDRSNQFVSVSDNNPVPRATYNELVRRREIAQNNAAVIQGIFRGVQTVGNEGSDNPNTLASKRDMRHESMIGRSANEPFSTSDIDPRRIVNANAADRLLLQAMKQSSPGHLRKEIRQHRGEVDRALEIMGENSYRKEMDSLSDMQFFGLWSDPGFAAGLFSDYEAIRKQGLDIEESDAFDVDRIFPKWARKAFPGKGNHLPV